MRMPVMFMGHGSPMNAIEDNQITRTWKAIGQRFKPKAILMVSGHWFTDKTYVQASVEPDKINDMYGFPKALYDIEYPVKGDLDLSRWLVDRVSAELNDQWGIDHGAWSILVHMFPEADIPVVQLSVNKTLSPEDHYKLGRMLRPLRDEGVLILGSGNVVHSFKYGDFSMEGGHPWAVAFDQIIEASILEGNHSQVIQYHALADANKAVPTSDHFDPLLYVLGATYEEDAIEIHNKIFQYGGFSMTSYIFL